MIPAFMATEHQSPAITVTEWPIANRLTQAVLRLWLTEDQTGMPQDQP